VNPGTRRIALFAIAAIAIAASANALAHSYAGLYAWALHHRLTGWQAVSWPAEIDVFLAVGELALYVAYLDSWPVRQRYGRGRPPWSGWPSAWQETSATSSRCPAIQYCSPIASPRRPARSLRSLA
jgi:hypothetical protein